ncbi:hypothetical protein EWF20_08710 [Sulfolobus sp. S-194]|uniref:hypothetical protein n=1 Tax=Sulfolobus sp. S-194 TaxID=2512240 RepID=UPI00143722BB|nr:hypothetical protein [Sulfolobus sp. S-194]QIW24217.1 hypothetical protein EWF20_08710 [Sulfolobus sp. S-194]
MSILNEEEFRLLREHRGKVNINIVEKILSEIEEDYEKTNNIVSSVIFVYSNYFDIIKQNKDTFDLISKILNKYTSKIGAENVIQLIINSLK